jgi:hypothetical protein
MRRVVTGLLVVALCAGMRAGALALDHPISAHGVEIKSNAAGNGKLLFLSKDGGIVGPTAAGTDDPSVHGASLELCAPGDRTGWLGLSASGWKSNGPGTVWRFVARGNSASFMRQQRNRGPRGGPGGRGPQGIKVALVKDGSHVKLVGRSTGLVLDEPLGQVAVRLTMGDNRHCALFGPSTVTRDEPGRFQARGAVASALADCSDEALGCPLDSASGAFVR